MRCVHSTSLSPSLMDLGDGKFSLFLSPPRPPRGQYSVKAAPLPLPRRATLLLGSQWLPNHVWNNSMHIRNEESFKYCDICVLSMCAEPFTNGRTAVHQLWLLCQCRPISYQCHVALHPSQRLSATVLRLSFSIVLHTYVSCRPVVANNWFYWVLYQQCAFFILHYIADMCGHSKRDKSEYDFNFEEIEITCWSIKESIEMKYK